MVDCLYRCLEVVGRRSESSQVDVDAQSKPCVCTIESIHLLKVILSETATLFSSAYCNSGELCNGVLVSLLLRRARLKSLLSIRYEISIPGGRSSCMIYKIIAMKMRKRVSAITQSFSTPEVTLKGLELSPLIWTLAIISS